MTYSDRGGFDWYGRRSSSPSPVSERSRAVSTEFEMGSRARKSPNRVGPEKRLLDDEQRPLVTEQSQHPRDGVGARFGHLQADRAGRGVGVPPAPQLRARRPGGVRSAGNPFRQREFAYWAVGDSGGVEHQAVRGVVVHVGGQRDQVAVVLGGAAGRRSPAGDIDLGAIAVSLP